MRKSILLGLLSALAITMAGTAANACPAGYKRVTIQGNSVCQLDVSASNKLKAATTPKPSAAIKKLDIRKQR